MLERAWMIYFVGIPMIAGCGQSNGASNDAGSDGTTIDAASFDAPADQSIDTGADANDAAPPVYNDLTNPTNWTTFDVSTAVSGAHGFAGGAFDGQYIYFVPDLKSNGFNGVVARYDTHASFATSTSWSSFDLSTVNPGAVGFSGATFDGRYIYLAPYFNNSGLSGIVASYDTHGTFTTSSSWSTFDVSTTNGGTVGFEGAIFDGHYVYLVPANEDGNLSAEQYDTSGLLTGPSWWSAFELAPLNGNNPEGLGSYGGAFDGRYVYFAPSDTSGALALRYDTQQATFTMSSAWSTFGISTVNANAAGFRGAVFDGRYVYYIPENNNNNMPGIVARYDTQGDYGSAGSWSTFVVSTLNATIKAGGELFAGGAFDGRYVYLVPSGAGEANGIAVRYDTQADFENASSWSTFDVSSVNTNASGFFGAVFDGQYVYFIGTVVARFAARTSPSMPKLPGWFSWGPGSFL